eukprot:261086_1
MPFPTQAKYREDFLSNDDYHQYLQEYNQNKRYYYYGYYITTTPSPTSYSDHPYYTTPSPTTALVEYDFDDRCGPVGCVRPNPDGTWGKCFWPDELSYDYSPDDYQERCGPLGCERLFRDGKWVSCNYVDFPKDRCIDHDEGCCGNPIIDDPNWDADTETGTLYCENHPEEDVCFREVFGEMIPLLFPSGPNSASWNAVAVQAPQDRGEAGGPSNSWMISFDRPTAMIFGSIIGISFLLNIVFSLIQCKTGRTRKAKSKYQRVDTRCIDSNSEFEVNDEP